MNGRPGRNVFMIVFTVIALATFLLQFRRSLAVSGAFFALGLLISGLRVYYIAREEKRRVSVGTALDYSKLKTLRINALCSWLKANVRGHDECIDDFARQLRNNIQLARSGRTLGSFLLIGPTGTGKSFLAQLVSEVLFPGVEPVMLRMNQLKSPDDVFTLIGAPPGRAGFELGGALTKPVHENPFRVVILDELEKAHPDIFDCLYDILDTGTCREKSTGRMIDFSGCLFFATSNASVQELRAAKAKSSDAAGQEACYREALCQEGAFSRAFVARWERVYFLDTLSEFHVAEVACLNISKYWKQFGMRVAYASPEVILQTVLKNRDFKEFGVRQLMTFIRQKSDPIVQTARARGQLEVYLELGKNGDFVIGVPPQQKASYGVAKKVA